MRGFCDRCGVVNVLHPEEYCPKDDPNRYRIESKKRLLQSLQKEVNRLLKERKSQSNGER